jgi:hypothetical protein
MRNSLRVLALIAAPLSGVVGAEAATILMPSGSTVWMKMNSSVLPQHGGSCWNGVTGGADDCVASNQAGPNPANGIPTTSFGSGQGTVTTSAEVLPDQMRGFLNGRSSQLTISLEDTYTVHGTLPGSFDITVELNATGIMRSLAILPGSSIGHQLTASVEAEIGTFNPESNVDIPESQRVTAFAGFPNASKSFSRIGLAAGSPFSVPFDITASHTLANVLVGGSFTLGLGVLSFVSLGEIDMLNTAGISFILPDGVFLTSALGGRFGDAAIPSEVPLPAALPLFAGGLGLVALLARRRKENARSAGAR